MSRFQTFNKRPGTTDKGKEFENLIVAKLIVDLLKDDDTDDFHISSNDGDFGAFDDVVIEVKKHNQHNFKFAVQLKHSNNTKSLTLNSLSARTGNFSIIKYFVSFQKCKGAMSGYKLVLSTTFKLNFSDGIKIQLDDDEIFYVEILRSVESTTLLNTSTDLNHRYKFQIVKDITICPFTEKMQEYQDFFQRFYLYTDQKDVDQIRIDVSKQLQEEFNCDESIFNTYMTFINEWSIREGKKEMLNKRMTAKFLTLSLLSRSIYPHSFGGYVGENAEILQKAIAKFTVTVFDESSLEKVRRLWSDAKEKLKKRDINEVNRVGRLHNSNRKCVDDLDKLDDKDCSKFMWYLDDEEYPLIVEESSLTYKAISLCSDKKYVIIRRGTSSMVSNRYTVWEKLSNLRVHAEVFKALTLKFKCQFPGRVITLKDLITKDKNIIKTITTNELIKMVEHPYVVNEETNDELPEPYVTRFLSGNFIDLKYLESVEEDTFVVLSNVREQDLTNYSNRKNFHIIKEKCCQEEFSQICEKIDGIQKFYHFLMIDENLQLVRSKGDISALKHFRIASLAETAFYNPHNLNGVNIITCEPGMGKSVFLKGLKNNLSTHVWNVILTPNDMSAICHQFRERLQRDQIQDFIVEMKFPDYNEFQKSIVKMLMVEGKICYSWDALDEVTNENLMFIVDVIHSFSETDCIQWLTSRHHLKDRLEEKFNLLSLSISPFDDQQQTCYIQVRLETTGLESEVNTTEKIKKIITFNANTNVLGIPLQIFMLTELFRQDVNLINKNLFSLSDLYQYFVDAKFNFFYNKTGVDISKNDSLRTIFESDKARRIGNYQRLALELLFNVEFLTHVNIKCRTCGDFLKELRQGDQFGLITTDRQNTEFVHISYAEYFAATYFAEHYKDDLGLENIIFDERYNNVRFFLDCLLARNSPPHLAVLCKNLELLKRYEENLGDYEDLAGRNLLHLAASWGERHHLFDVRKSNNFTFVDIIDSDVENGAKSEEEILQYLSERCDVKGVDDRFKLDCLACAEKFHCLINLIIIENSKKTGYLNSKNDKFISNILCYSTYFGYNGIIEIYMDHVVKLKIRTEYFSRTLLHIASMKGHCTIARLLINSGANIDALDKYYWTPLHYASENGRLDVARLLINSGANIQSVGDFNRTPLHYASEKEQFEMTQLLIKSGANLEAVDKYGCTPLHCASENGRYESAQLLINSGANLEAIDKYSCTPLHYASKKGRLEIVRLLINSGANIEAVDKYNCTPLHYASENGRSEVVQLLINLGANIEAVSVLTNTPLHRASMLGKFEVGQLLLKSGAKIEPVDRMSCTPLHYASQNGQFQIAQLLINSGLNIEAMDWKGYTPLHYASDKGQFEIARLLINSGANIEAVDKYSRTPLYYASDNGRLEITQLLINSGANVEAYDENGFAPLHCTSENGQFEITQLLIISGANINAVDNGRRTPLHYASANGRFQISQLLINYGADIEAADKHSRTPLYYASENGRLEVAQLLINSGANLEADDRNGFTPLHCASENGEFRAAQLLINSGANIEAVDERGFQPLHYALKSKRSEIAQLLINSGGKKSKRSKIFACHTCIIL